MATEVVVQQLNNKITVTDGDKVNVVQQVTEKVVVKADGAVIYQVSVNVAGYSHTQSSPSAMWTIVHNLGFIPAGILVKDTAGDGWLPKVVENTVTYTILSFNGRTVSGEANLS